MNGAQALFKGIEIEWTADTLDEGVFALGITLRGVLLDECGKPGSGKVLEQLIE